MSIESSEANLPWSNMMVVELKVECKKRGLSVSGKKADIVERIVAPPMPCPPPPQSPITDQEYEEKISICDKELIDSMSHERLVKCIDNYDTTIRFEREINRDLITSKKIRLSNFPSHISENIVKFAIYKKYEVMPNWDTDKGDLILKSGKNIISRLEVKGSINLSNGGPSSFGRGETWDRIYFVDGVDGFEAKRFKVYEIKLSNSCTTWQNLKMTKTKTYYDKCLTAERPRVNFAEILPQLHDHCEIIFEGHISELNNTV